MTSKIEAKMEARQSLSQTPLLTVGLSDKELEKIAKNPKITFAYIPDEVSHALLKIERVLLKKDTSHSAKNLYNYLHADYKIAPQADVEKTVKSALVILRADETSRGSFKKILARLSRYNNNLDCNDAAITVSPPVAKGDSLLSKALPDVRCNVLASDWARMDNLFVHDWTKTGNLLVRKSLNTNRLHVKHDADIGGNLTVRGTINGGTIVGPTGPTGPAGATGATGATGTFSGTVKDTEFAIVDATDPTKELKFDVQGNPSTTTTIITNPTVDRSFITPDIDGTALVAQTGTNEVFIGGPTGPLHGSASGIQYSTTVANRAQIRFNQYGNNGGIPGISTFKSRGATIGSLAPVLPGDVIYRATAVGVTSNLSIPLSGLISINVAPNGVPAGQGWIATDYQIQLVPLTGPANGRKEVFRITSEGIFHIQEAANKMAGIATLGAAGTATVLNTQITASSKITLTIQDGGAVPTGFVYLSSRVVGTSFTITSAAGAADVGVKVYYQVWEPTTP